jgi:hypothetical protein
MPWKQSFNLWSVEDDMDPSLGFGISEKAATLAFNGS